VAITHTVPLGPLLPADCGETGPAAANVKDILCANIKAIQIKSGLVCHILLTPVKVLVLFYSILKVNARYFLL
jgi:hypothetical protein